MLNLFLKKYYDIKANPKVRSNLYDFWLGNLFLSTPKLYKQFLEFLPEGSKVLEVGIGNGLCLERNADLIKSKKLIIEGIDIDPDYMDICQQRIRNSGLTTCKASLQDLFTIKDEKYDYILFMESYPVIPFEVCVEMAIHCKGLLKDGGNLVYIHNINDKPTAFTAWVKPRVKDIPGVFVDFGRVVSTESFQNFLGKSDFKIESNTKLGSYKIPLVGYIANYMFVLSNN